MYTTKALGFLCLASLAAASSKNAHQCAQLKVLVKVEATNYNFTQPKVDSNIDLDDWYWDTEVQPDKYSYVDAALGAGYSILTYDRLGTGKSQKADAYTEVQEPVHVEIIAGLTRLARAGKLAQYAKASTDTAIRSYKPAKVVHIGHSVGSSLTLGFLATYSDLSDGIILTGFVISDKIAQAGPRVYDFQYARENDACKFEDRPSGYIVQGTKAAFQGLFLKKGNFDPALADYGLSIRETGTVSELLTVGFALSKPALFKGPVQLFLAEFDVILCAGDCNKSYDPLALRYFYPNASDISVYQQPGTGHGLTLSKNATAGYKAMFSYLASQKL